MWKEVVVAYLRYYPRTCLEKLRKTKKNSGYTVYGLRFEVGTSRKPNRSPKPPGRAFVIRTIIIALMMEAVSTLKRRSTSTKLHDAISQKAIIFIL
jgi:hypothetical protein